MDKPTSIIKKFNKLSSKEWLQYFQFKLSPEREKDMLAHAEHDAFLKEALDGFSDQNIRPLALQSYNYLLNSIKTGNGGASNNTIRPSSSMSGGNTILNTRNILILLLLLGAIIGMGFLIKYVIDSMGSDEDYTQEDTTIEAVETDIMSDDDNAPLETIPNSEAITASNETLETQTTISPENENTSRNRNQTRTQTQTETTSSNTQATNNTSLSTEEPTRNETSAPAQDFRKENELFLKAQQLYTQGKFDESKQILQSLSSYDNPKRAQAKKILSNLQ